MPKDFAGPDPIDAAVGNALRARRLIMGLTQQQLAQALGVKFQQVQKYERASNRVSASMLVRAAEALGCTVGDFFPDAGERTPLPSLLDVAGGAELNHLFVALSPERRKVVLLLAKQLSELPPA